MWLSSLDIFFLCPPLVPLAPFVLKHSVRDSRLHSGMRFDSRMSTYNRFQDCLFSRRYSLYGCVEGFKKTEKKEEETSRIQKQNTEPRLKCFRLCRYLLSGKWTFCSILFLILHSFHLSLYFCIFLFYWNVWVRSCCPIPTVFGYVDDLVIFWQFTPSFLSDCLALASPVYELSILSTLHPSNPRASDSAQLSTVAGCSKVHFV